MESPSKALIDSPTDYLPPLGDIDCVSRSGNRASFRWNLPNIELSDKVARECQEEFSYYRDELLVLRLKLRLTKEVYFGQSGEYLDLKLAVLSSYLSTYPLLALEVRAKVYLSSSSSSSDDHHPDEKRHEIPNVDGNFWKFLARTDDGGAGDKKIAECLKKGPFTVHVDLELLEPVRVRNDGRLLNFDTLRTNSLNCMVDSEKFSDVTLTIRGKQFRGHKCIICPRSPVFDQLFGETSQNVVKINDVTEDCMFAILRFIYDPYEVYWPEFKDAELRELYRAARLYKVSDVEDVCRLYMVNRLTVENAVDTLEFALSRCSQDGGNGLKVVEEKAIEVIAKAKGLLSDEDFEALGKLDSSLPGKILRKVSSLQLENV